MQTYDPPGSNDTGGGAEGESCATEQEGERAAAVLERVGDGHGPPWTQVGTHWLAGDAEGTGLMWLDWSCPSTALTKGHERSGFKRSWILSHGARGQKSIVKLSLAEGAARAQSGEDAFWHICISFPSGLLGSRFQLPVIAHTGKVCR